MTYRAAWAADPVAEAARDAATPRAVIQGAFGLLESLRDLGSARVSDLQRYCGLPRTTVQRLLGQLAEVGAVERSGAWWRLALIELGASVPAEPRLRSAARRPLLELATATRALVALSVDSQLGHWTDHARW